MTLDLEPEVESQLLAYANAEGTTASEYISRLLREKADDQHFGVSENKIKGRRASALGKYAFVAGGSEAFALEKQVEIDREDRFQS